jgi:hypothetical protein
MNRKYVSLLSLLMICSAVGVALAQQNVPPPPKPADDSSSAIGATAKSLEDKLKSIGRVSWSETTRNTNTNEVTGPTQLFSEVTRVSINPHTCEMRMAWNTMGGETAATFFLEETEGLTVSTWEQARNTYPGLYYTISPAIFFVRFGTAHFFTRDQETANQIAGAFRQLAQQCNASLPAAKTGSEPSWEETMNFIQDKLNQQGAVNYLLTTQNTAAQTSSSPVQISSQVSRVMGDPQSCRVNYHIKWGTSSASTPEFGGFFNLRRIETLTVMSLKDEIDGNNARAGHPETVAVISPAIWVLQVTNSAGNRQEIPFADEDLANRVAKALTHAVELCGGGSKEPF